MTDTPKILNDDAYSDGEENPLESLVTTLSCASDDWGATRAMAWTWGIVCGWDGESVAELALRYGWSLDAVTRLHRLHAEFDARRALDVDDAAAAETRALASAVLSWMDDNLGWVTISSDQLLNALRATGVSLVRVPPES